MPTDGFKCRILTKNDALLRIISPTTSGYHKYNPLKAMVNTKQSVFQCHLFSATNVRTPKRKPAKTEAYESPSPRKRGATRRKAREPSDSEEMEEDYSEEEVKPGRRAGRKASQVTKYSELPIQRSPSVNK